MEAETTSNQPGRAFFLFDNIEITDRQKLEEYKERVFPVVAAFGGKYIVASDKIRVVEGDWKPHHVIMIEFPDFEKANIWYDSEEYRELKNLRQSAGRFDGIVVEGL